jgi:hypothetical protein
MSRQNGYGGTAVRPAGSLARAGITRDLKFRRSRAHALKVFRFVVYATFGVVTSTNLIILSCLIDWIGVAESLRLY